MLNRWIGILCTLFMLSANTTLFVRDILPGLLAGDPPELDDLSLEAGTTRRIQTGVFNARDENIGRSWTVSFMQAGLLNVTSCTRLNPITLPNGLTTPGARIDTELRYRVDDGLLDSMSMSIRGLPVGVTMHGDFIPPDEFACCWRLGKVQRGTFRLSADATRALGDVLRPFTRLPGLYVGRTWRLHLLDPLAQVVPGLRNNDLLAEPILVRVTGTEMIEHRGQQLEVFVVEARRTRAWVDQQGNVLRQEIDVPLLGRLTLRDEPFDDEVFQEARVWSPDASEEE
ncbi:MAG: hypothetical protein PVJ57_04770 [Phycisphaerae bacterium]|jgi:hypothetical protein